uniref:Uncharacterized protein n=1 Tax=Arundo donax TaxID=35708 RepID=A0A0A9BJ12_ARUDO
MLCSQFDHTLVEPLHLYQPFLLHIII